MKLLKILVLVTGLSFFTIACGSSGGGGDNTSSQFTESPAGIWEGIIESNVTKEKYYIQGIISENNMIRLISHDRKTNRNFYTGVASGHGNEISTILTAYVLQEGLSFPDKSYVASISISGTISSRDHISLTYNGGGDSGTIELTYNNIYERPSALSSVEGTWEIPPPYIPDILEVSGSGKIWGTFKFIKPDCIFSGTMEIINPSYNAYKVNIRVTNCKDSDGDYSGLATLDDFNTVNDVVIMYVSSSSSVIYAYFVKK